MKLFPESLCRKHGCVLDLAKYSNILLVERPLTILINVILFAQLKYLCQKYYKILSFLP